MYSRDPAPTRARLVTWRGILSHMLVLALLAPALLETNSRPVVGVLYQPIDESLQELCPSCGSYVVASYVQWLQSAGARVALLPVSYTHLTLPTICSV